MLLATGRIGLILLARRRPPGGRSTERSSIWGAWPCCGGSRAEGIAIRDLIGAIKLPRNILTGLGYYCLVFRFFVGGGLLSTKLVYGSMLVDASHGFFMARTLPARAIVYSLSAWWMIWSPTEELTYQAYALPRIQALSGRTWMAMAIVGFGRCSTACCHSCRIGAPCCGAFSPWSPV